MATDRNDASTATRESNTRVLGELPFEDTDDRERVDRGFIATNDEVVIRNDAGKVVFDMDQYGFIEGDAPPTANPSLWRQEKLNNVHGLFEVADGIYQVRGYDVSNVSFIAGETGWIVVDPLACRETAKVALDLVNAHLEPRPIKAVIYSHSHVDHFGGVGALVTPGEVESGEVRIIAPDGFMEHAISENVYAGIAMGRRTSYQFGNVIPKDARGFVGAGLGKSFSEGAITLIPPTDVITETGQELTVDGVRMEFQNVPGSEAPAELHFFLPERRALCIAENCVASIHNVLTMRGAQVRDSLAWSKYLEEAIDLYADRTDVLFMSHTWPRWGREYVTEYIAKQRDVYRYIHDQSLRLANAGLTMVEIAEEIELPEELASEFFCRGYYGTVNHDVKAVYQRYLGWWDGNPANLHRHTPVEAGRRYVEALGGAETTLSVAQKAFEDGDYRWVAELVNHLVFAEPDNEDARELQAAALEQLGYQAESGIWRSFYLSGAHELRNGISADVGIDVEQGAGEAGIISALTLEGFLDSLGTRLNASNAAGKKITMNFNITDKDEHYVVYLNRSVLRHAADREDRDADCTLRMTRGALDAIALDPEAGFQKAMEAGEIQIEGDAVKLAELFSLIDTFDIRFPIVTP